MKPPSRMAPIDLILECISPRTRASLNQMILARVWRLWQLIRLHLLTTLRCSHRMNEASKKVEKSLEKDWMENCFSPAKYYSDEKYSYLASGY
uniref:Uncharacterized protein n=1 Tax=Trichogramma kaykai TaxID=54128 RepID=A0ABD2WBL6_9HYME